MSETENICAFLSQTKNPYNTPPHPHNPTPTPTPTQSQPSSSMDVPLYTINKIINTFVKK